MNDNFNEKFMAPAIYNALKDSKSLNPRNGPFTHSDLKRLTKDSEAKPQYK